MAASREQDYISAAKSAAKKLWDGLHELLSLQDEWNALDYGNTLDEGAGANAGLTRTDVGAVVFDTANEAKLRLIDTAHKTNLAKLL
jgi:hypothetical protein